jgi:hypothetical protein
MQLPQLKPRGKARRDHRRSTRGPAAPPDPKPPATREAAERRDARRGGGPQDTAFYVCGCGYAFTAPVSTSVVCPHCRADQAW